jgi:hypothetical protein
MERYAILNPTIELAAGLRQSKLAKIVKYPKLTDLIQKMLHGMGNIKVNEKRWKDADMEECILYGSTQLLLCKRMEQEESQKMRN